MQATAVSLPGLLLLEPQVFSDRRGFFTETYNEARWRSLGLPTEWVQDNRSRSRRGVLRGLHFQTGTPQGKLVSVVYGEVYDVAVDIRRGSPTFGKWFGTILRDDPVQALYIPRGFAHGLYVLSEIAEVSYKCDTLYDAARDRGIRWNDPELGIAWPDGERLLSPKDEVLPTLAEFLRDAPDELPEFEGERSGATR